MEERMLIDRDLPLSPFIVKHHEETETLDRFQGVRRMVHLISHNPIAITILAMLEDRVIMVPNHLVVFSDGFPLLTLANGTFHDILF